MLPRLDKLIVILLNIELIWLLAAYSWELKLILYFAQIMIMLMKRSRSC